MRIKVGINGLGRIGRMIIRSIIESKNKNIEIKNFNRKNIDEIINKKISNLPILDNDTNNVIFFNDGFSNELNNDKPRSFWKLIKPE